MRKMTGLLLALCLLGALLPGARAEAQDPVQMAKNLLTEVYGYTEAEAEAFTFDDPGDGLHFAPADHPEWEYFLPYDDETGAWDVSGAKTPFMQDGSYYRYPGEGAVRGLLRRAEEENWFGGWTAEDREALRAALIGLYEQMEVEDPASRLTGAMLEVLSGESDAAGALQTLFEQLFGPVENWSAATLGWRDELLARWGLRLTAGSPLARGIRTFHTNVYYRGGKTADFVRFLEEVPAELDGALGPFRAKGWEALTGGYLRFDTPAATTDGDRENELSGMGLIVLGKEARRLTCILDCRAGAWELWALGENCLPQGQLPAIGLYSHIARFSLTWPLDGERELRMTVLPAVAANEEHGYVQAVCELEACTVVNLRDGSTVLPIATPRYLGEADLSGLPAAWEETDAAHDSVVPEGYVMAGGVHLRADHSSHSEDLGLLTRGVLLPVEEVVDGTEYPWIRTRLGPLKGYVSANYTSYEGWGISETASIAPVPVAEARQALALRGDTGFFGTGLLAPTLAELPAGARMHVLIFNGDWLFVAAPRSEPGWFMDPDSDFGWVRASEVRLASTNAQLDWME